MNIFQRINEVRKAIAYVQKDKDVSTGKGTYRAVTHDMVTAMVRPHLVVQGLVCFPHLVESAMIQPVDQDGKPTNQKRYEATYDFTWVNVEAPEDRFVVRIQAHAMDNADKAPGKAMSYAMKYNLLKVLNLETGEDDEGRGEEAGMSASVKADFMAAIESATTPEELNAIWKVAVATAKKLDDLPAGGELKKAAMDRAEQIKAKE